MKVINRKQNQGLSIVEFLVAIAIGLLILSGVILTLSNSKRNFVDQEELAFIQENARFAIDLIGRDLRLAGYMGCAPPGVDNLVSIVGDDVDGFISLSPLEGFEDPASSPAFSTNSPRANTDAIIVRHADAEDGLTILEHDPSNMLIGFHSNHSFPAGTTAMIVDANCRYVSLFQVTTPASVPDVEITYERDTSAGIPSTNCTDFFRGAFDCSDCNSDGSDCGPNTESSAYSPGSTVMRYYATGYFIGESNIIPGMPALKRKVIFVDGGLSVETREEELIAGVEDMEIIYGADVDDDGDVDRYLRADQMDVDTSGTIDEDDWALVRIVRISFTFRSQTLFHDSNQNVPNLNGEPYNDRFLRQAITTTVQLRNRG